MEQNLVHLLPGFLASVAPMLLVWVTGAVVALANWQRCPMPPLLVLLAMLDLALFGFITRAMNMLIFPVLSLEHGMQGAQLAWLYNLNGLAGTIGTAIGMFLLLAAVYSGRPRAAHAGGALEGNLPRA